jgi:hypothetical protein
MRVVEFINNIEETVGAGGVEYENRVYAALQSAQVPGLDPGASGGAGYSNVGAGDIEATFNGNAFNIEVKANKNAQLGGTSVRVDPENNAYEIVTPDAIDADAIPFYIQAAKNKADDAVAYVDFVRTLQPTELHANLPHTIPFGSVTKEAWNQAQAKGFLTKLNAIESFDNAKIIAATYNRKGVYYIQIGGAGLFYLGSNPLNLPVPEFDGAVNIEFRLGRSGSRDRKLGDQVVSVVAAGYRCQGRLKTNIKSPYTLDDPASIRKLFGV